MPIPIPQKPQPLRQAKKAYQKASGPRISDAERRRLQRAEQLQERADRIKEKDKQKRINRKKKEEKEQKERDTRRRMGLETEREDKLSPRQVRIGVFFGRGEGREDGGGMVCTKRRKIEVDSTGEEDGKRQLRREPLKEIQPNLVCQEDEAANGSHSRPEPKGAPAPLLSDEEWASFFASSTQIAREISEPKTTNSHPRHFSQSPQPSPALPPPATHPSNPDVAECLALLSSQDLEDYEGTPATSKITIITADHPQPQKPPIAKASSLKPPTNLIFSDFPFISTQDLAFTDEDLQDLGLALPTPRPPSPLKKRKPANPLKSPSPLKMTKLARTLIKPANTSKSASKSNPPVDPGD